MKAVFSLIILLTITFNSFSRPKTIIPEQIRMNETQILSVLCELYKKSGGIYATKEHGLWCYTDGTFDFWKEKHADKTSISPRNEPDPSKTLWFSAHTHPKCCSPFPSLNDKLFVSRYENSKGEKVHLAVPMLIIHPAYGITLYSPLSTVRTTDFIMAEPFRAFFRGWKNNNPSPHVNSNDFVFAGPLPPNQEESIMSTLF